MTDSFLRRFTAEHSETAFGELVARPLRLINKSQLNRGEKII
jgi:hypothetical protein